MSGCGGDGANDTNHGAGGANGTRGGLSAAALATLVAGHRGFVAFVQRRVGDRALAEDLVQQAFVTGLERGAELRDDEAVRAWFFRVRRNAIVDRHRRASVAAARLEAFADELRQAELAPSAAAEREVCACLVGLLDALPPDQAAALRRIELDGIAVKEFAREAGIGESNAGVRVFRARKALRQLVARACGTCAEHGCLDCTCGKPARGD